MKGILGKLFGGGGSGGGSEPASEPVEYKGFRIRPEPYPADGQFQTAGVIEKDFPEGTKAHRFVRAERHVTRDEAVSFALTKGMLIVDQNGDKLFDS